LNKTTPNQIPPSSHTIAQSKLPEYASYSTLLQKYLFSLPCEVSEERVERGEQWERRFGIYSGLSPFKLSLAMAFTQYITYIPPNLV
jgi:hypothetical protein